MLERLHKVLARAGVAALRPAEDMIMAGRVTVNGRVVRELGARVDPGTDVIAVDGQLVELRGDEDPFHYLIVHKPEGVISTAHDTHGRPTVVGLVPSNARLFPVGRLDGDSEGLMLLTDDGDLAYRLTHPRFEVEKEYRVLLDRTPTIEDLRQWREGVVLEGEPTMPAWVEVLDRSTDGTWVRVVMREGRKRQIREVARLLGYQVLRLIRVREGPLTLGDLGPGEWRELTATEIQMLRAHTQHIPSRAIEEERERRMMDRDRPEGRRLRVIRGPRRSTAAESERAVATDRAEPTAPTESTPRARVYNQTTNNEPPAARSNDRAQFQRQSPRDEQSRARGESPRHGHGGSQSGGQRFDRDNRGDPRRSTGDRGGPRRAPEFRSQQGAADRRGARPYTERGNQRPSDDRRRSSYDNEQRGPDYGNERGGPDYGNQRRGPAYGSQRASNNRRDQHSGNERSRPYGPRRDQNERRGPDQQPSSRGPASARGSTRGNERRDYDEQRRPFGERDTGNRRPGGYQRAGQGERGNFGSNERPSRPGTPPRGRGGYGQRDAESRAPNDRDYAPRSSQRRFDRDSEGQQSRPRPYPSRPAGDQPSGRAGAPRRDDERGNSRPPSRESRFDESRGRDFGGRPDRGATSGGRPGGAGRSSGPRRSDSPQSRSGGPGRSGGTGGGRPGGSQGRTGGPGRPGASSGNRSNRPGPRSGAGGRGPSSTGTGPRRRPERDDDDS